MKSYQEPRNCGTCLNLIVGRYQCPVCYKIEQRNGKPVAIKRMRGNKACQAYKRKG